MQYGRDQLEAITGEIEGKSEEEVRAYAKVFWQRAKDLTEWERILKNIERGEQRIQRQVLSSAFLTCCLTGSSISLPARAGPCF